MLRLELDRLKHKDVRQRRRAVRRLFELDNPAALTGFVSILDDSDSWFHDKSVEAIRLWAGPENKTLVVSLAVHQSQSMRLLASEIAPRLGSSSLDILSTLCLDDDLPVRRAAWRSRLMVDTGSIPVAIVDEDHHVRRLAINRSGDANLIENSLKDSHVRVRDAALNRMIALEMEIEGVDALLADNELRDKVADYCLPFFIKNDDQDTISKLCLDCDSALRKILSKHLEAVNWFDWKDVVTAAKQSKDEFLLPRLLRSRREPEADTLRISLLKSSSPIVQSRVLEHMHGRQLSDAVHTMVESLTKSDDSLVAQAATSLLDDQAAILE
ncbi:MAG: hypothetical protein QGF94_00390 [Candidatus Thalassarchaeaceae archaeon]|jgi:hypothetical protein|nr:hypothetical protein [Candidatus Thalassarchaeaceae archaeon]